MANKWINSADSHVNEPPDLWTGPLGAKWGDALPHFVEPEPGKTEGTLFFTGEDYLAGDGLAEFDDEMLARIDRACKEPAFRAQCMDEDGVYAEVLFPTFGLMVFPLPNGDLVRDCFGIYNDWLVEYCSQAPKRFLGAALIQMEDVDWAIEEAERMAKRGMCCAMINTDTRREWGRYQDKKYDPFWARMQEMGWPVAMHISTGQRKDMFFYHGEKLRDLPGGYLDLFAEAGYAVANEFIFGGIMDRFPDLKVYLVEYEASWLPHWLYRLEQLAADFGPNMGLQKLKNPVREYLKRIYVGVIDDPLIQTVTGPTDPNFLVWGSDFPHVRNTHMKSHQVVEKSFGHLDQKTIDNITIHNAVELFKIDMPVTG